MKKKLKSQIIKLYLVNTAQSRKTMLIVYRVQNAPKCFATFGSNAHPSEYQYGISVFEDSANHKHTLCWGGEGILGDPVYFCLFYEKRPDYDSFKCRIRIMVFEITGSGLRSQSAPTLISRPMRPTRAVTSSMQAHHQIIRAGRNHSCTSSSLYQMVTQKQVHT